MALLPLVASLQEEPSHGEVGPHAQRAFCSSEWTNCSEPVNTTLNSGQNCSKGWSSCEALGGGQGRGLTWNLVLVPCQAWLIILTRSCLKASAWDDTLRARKGFTTSCEHAKWRGLTTALNISGMGRSFSDHKPRLVLLGKDITRIYIWSCILKCSILFIYFQHQS